MFKKLLKLLLSGKRKFVAVGVALVLFITLFSHKAPLKVQTTKVTRGDIVEAVSSSGYIFADQKSDLTFLGGGLVRWVGVKVGDSVKKGQGIASLDSTILNSTYQESINTYMSLNAAAQKAEDDVKGHSGDETFTQKATRMAAETARDSAYDTMKAARQALSQATIYAPFNGVITEASPSSPGSNVLPASSVYTIVNPDTVYFDAQIGETDLPKVALGQTVNIKLDAYPDQVFQGAVTNIGLVAFTSSTGGNAYHVRVSLPKNENLRFKIGMGGDADIVYKIISDTLKVPTSAVFTDSTDYIWTISAGRAKKIKVELGGVSSDETEIKSGISEGSVVISDPPTNLKEGQKVLIGN